MLALFLQRTKGESVSLSSSNYKAVLDNTRRIPVFIKVWSPTCVHCKAFAPLWENITNRPEFQGKVIFADINSMAHYFLCKRFPGSATPRLFWSVDYNKDPSPYLSALSEETLIEFINSQLEDEMPSVTNVEDLRGYRKSHQPMIVFNITEGDTTARAEAAAVQKKLKNFPVTFVVYKDFAKHYPRMRILDGSETPLDYEGNFKLSELEKFITHHSQPFLSLYSIVSAHQSEILEIPVAVFIRGHPEDPKSIKIAAERIRPQIQTHQLFCQANQFFCSYVGVRKNESVLVVYNKLERRYWKLDYQANPHITDKWMSQVLSHKIPGEGPGPGIVGGVLDVFKTLKVQNKPIFFILLVPLSVSLVAILIVSVHGLRMLFDSKKKLD